MAVLVVFPVLVTGTCYRFADRGSEDLECASDAVAAETVGAVNVINMLLRLADRAEVLSRFEERLAELLEANPKLDTQVVCQELFGRIREASGSPAQIRLLLSAPLESQSEGGKVEENQEFVEAVAKRKKERESLDVIDWRSYDLVFEDDRLDERELPAYVRTLLGTEDRLTHRLPEQHPGTIKHSSHPSMRNRVVYLYCYFLGGNTPD